MKEILMYENRKSGTYIWDISTPELKDQAFLKLFRVLDEEWNVYFELKELKQPESPGMSREEVEAMPEGSIRESALEALLKYEKSLKEFRLLEEDSKLYELAKEGDVSKAKLLLELHRDYEYEKWDTHQVM